MLNLSDKELDRLAREAADEYEPGSQASPAAWDRMQLRLDKEMGRFRPNLLRSIRRIPFYFAPAVLLLVGLSYYLVRSSRTPSSVARSSATRFPAAGSSATGSSSTGSSSTGSSSAGSSATSSSSAGSSATTKPAPAITMAENSGSPPASGTGAPRPLQATSDQSIHNSKNTYSSTSTHYNEISNGNKATGSSSGSAPVSGSGSGSVSTLASGSAPSSRPSSGSTSASGSVLTPSSGSSSTSGLPSSGSVSTSGSPLTPSSSPGSLTAPGATAITHTHNRPQRFTSPGRTTHQLHPAAGALNQNNNHNIIKDLRLSVVNAPSPTSQPAPLIDDAGLRKAGKRITTLLVTSAAAEPVNPGKKPSPSMHIDRPLQLGFSLSPDFTSVNTLAADRPGSNIGVTADYQLLNRLHIHTGFSLSHKNYTAAQQDYHVPYNYYRMNNMHDVSFVKGTLNLFEIPLALRYDFSVAGNTVFFASGGVSSYLLTHENCNYYFDLFGRSSRQEFKYGSHNLSLFSTVDLSMGVETGLSNSLSFLIAPYMKLPTTGLGFGRVEMSSVGVEFALKYSPVLRRRRH